MNWFIDLFTQAGVSQTILILTVISVTGLLLGQQKIAGFSLGGSFVFFAAIAAGHFAEKLGILTNADMMDFAKNFGLVIFVYALGLQCGPGFFNSLRKGGMKLILCALAVILMGSVIAAVAVNTTGLTAPQAVGLLSGASTNTPALISAQQTVLDMNPSASDAVHDVGAAYAVAYPFSIISVILSIMILARLCPASVKKSRGGNNDKYTAATEVHVSRPEVIGKQLRQVVKESGFHFVVSRLWRQGQVQIPVSDTVLEKDDHLLLICDKDDLHKFGNIFGNEESTDWNRPDIDWNIIDKQLVSRHIHVTRDEVVGISLGNLKLRNKYGVNITRINRAGITIVPSASTTLQFGDELTVVGGDEKIKILAKAMGNEGERLNEPRIIPILTGIFLGVLLGSIPFRIPGISMPVKLGIAGGPIIMGILMGAFGPKLHLTTFTTRSSNLMIRQLGITFFFASLGFGVGKNFAETVFCLQGLKWAATSVVIAMLPLLITGLFNDKVLKMDFARNAGVLCGAMSNPNALNYANTVLENDSAAESYATVYPLTTFIRVFISQMLIIALF